MNNQSTPLQNIISILTIFMFASFFLFETYTWGRFILLGVSVLILLLSAIENHGKIMCAIHPWHYFILAIALFSLTSSLWAVSSADAIQKFITTMQILVCLSFLYSYYGQEDNIYRLINIIKWAGYCVAIYAFIFYGKDFILQMIRTSRRLENGFSNVNSIGLLSSFSIIIEIYEIRYQKKVKISALLMIPSFMMVLATQSRKAFVLLVLGIFLVLLVSSNERKNTIQKAASFCGLIVLFGIAGFFLLKLPVFSGINERFLYLLETARGQGEAGSSAVLRSQMFAIGWKYFCKSPIVGIGYGCPHVIAAREMHFDAYLHNNYIELLAGGGIVGFSLYYSMYVYLFKKIYNYRNVAHYGKAICLIMLFLFLVMDFGMVNCYSKEMYFYFMIFFLLIEQLRNNQDILANQ